MKILRLMLLLLGLLITGDAFSQAWSYAWYRRVDAVADSGWQAIQLSPAILTRSESDLRDFRVYHVTKDTFEIPYILHTASEVLKETAVDFQIINKGYDQTRGLYQLTLHQIGTQSVNRVILDFEEQNFDWEVVSLEGSFDQHRWILLARNQRITSFQNSDVDYRYSTVRFDESNYSFYRLHIRAVVSAGQSSPLQIRRATIDRVTKKNAQFDTLAILVPEVAENVNGRFTETVLFLPNAQYVDQLDVHIRHSSDFHRRFTVEYLADSVRRENTYEPIWGIYASGTLSSWEPVHIRNLGVRTARLRLRIFNRDDRPLSIEKVFLLSYRRSLVCRLSPGGDHILAYGKKGDREPEYDLVSFQSRIALEPKAIGLGKEEPLMAQGVQVFFTSQLWIWTAMIAVIIVMVAFAIRMIRHSKTPSD